jgi:hypothetical protein
VDHGPLAAEAADALDVLHKTLDGITAMDGSAAKTEAIRDFAESVQELYFRAASVRKGEMLRIREEEKLSLAKLADRVGISKARADQIIRAEREKEKEEAPDGHGIPDGAGRAAGLRGR